MHVQRAESSGKIQSYRGQVIDRSGPGTSVNENPCICFGSRPKSIDFSCDRPVNFSSRNRTCVPALAYRAEEEKRNAEIEQKVFGTGISTLASNDPAINRLRRRWGPSVGEKDRRIPSEQGKQVSLCTQIIKPRCGVWGNELFGIIKCLPRSWLSNGILE